jgi:hypothetical protein
VRERKIILVALTGMELNFDEFKWGGLYEKHGSSNLEIGNHLSLCLKAEEVMQARLYFCKHLFWSRFMENTPETSPIYWKFKRVCTIQKRGTKSLCELMLARGSAGTRFPRSL